MYQFALLDPRSIPAATEANEQVFASGAVYGIEVTVPALAKRCAFNLDPQHSGGDASRAAIEEAMTAELPAEGTTFVTVRADLDSVGGMAILALRRTWLLETGQEWPYGYPDQEEILSRISQVATADKFARGPYSGPQPLPTRDNPWPTEGAADSTKSLAAINAAVSDFKVPIADRVVVMEHWLLTGEVPEVYRDRVAEERLNLITALESGAIKSEVVVDGRIAFVESTHRAATMVGYCLAPVVIALNPAFRQGPGDPCRKFTICAYSGEYADIKSALAELTTMEPGWGGSPTIGGSPQGVSSTLSVEQVTSVVAKYLK